MKYVCQKCGKRFDYDDEASDFYDRVNGWLDEGGTPPDLNYFWDDGPLCADCAVEKAEEEIQDSMQYQ